MHIKNLGPIKDASINLNELNIFIGKNGTGKTVAAYAIYSFIYWLMNFYVPTFYDANDIEEIIKKGKKEFKQEEVISYFINEILEQFNGKENKAYFYSFFMNKGIYKEESSIHIEVNDILAFVLPERKKHGWYFSWPYEGTLLTNTTTNNINFDSNSQQHNEILSTYKNGKIETSFSFPISARENDILNSDEQFESLKNTMGMARAISSINRGIKAVLFNCMPVYLPAERIGINIFRPYLNLTRLNKNEGHADLETNAFDNSKLERYSQPIESYISFVNTNLINGNQLYNQNSENNDSKLLDLMGNLVPGEFIYNKETDKVSYKLPTSDEQVDFELLSSSLKSIFGLDLFMKNNSIGDWLFVDEPEMNLHPANQVISSELLYELAKHEYRMVISTHSDYFMKALINYVLEDRLHGNDYARKINVYDFSENSVKKLNNVFDIDTSVDNFDDTTNDINAKYYELVEKINERG